MCGCPKPVPWRAVAARQERSDSLRAASCSVPHPPPLTPLLCLLAAPCWLRLLPSLSPVTAFHCSGGGGRRSHSPAAGHIPAPGAAAPSPKQPESPGAQGAAEEHQAQRSLSPSERGFVVCRDGGSMSSHLDSLESVCCWSHNHTQEPLVSEAAARTSLSWGMEVAGNAPLGTKNISL